MCRATFLIGLPAVLLVTACTDSGSNPAAPTAAQRPNFSRSNLAAADAPLSPSFSDVGSLQGENPGFLRLVAVIGRGHGWIRATRIPNPTTPANFAIHVEITMHDVKPNTAYVGQSAGEVFNPPGPPAGFDVATLTDGSCQRGLGLPPWSTLVPTPPAFVTFPDQAHGLPAVIITTDGEGNGAADFVVAFGFPRSLYDVMFRVIEKSGAPKSVLLSDCTILPLPAAAGDQGRGHQDEGPGGTAPGL